MNYRTVKNDAFEEMIERKSKFIGYCRPVKTQDEAISFINEIREKHRQATHNVYAYVLRRDNIMRYSDDGEPSGTAGMPVMNVIKKEGLTDVCVVVTRYFGGILLGAGGLVRAYGKSAKLGIDAAKRVEMRKCCVFIICCSYTDYGNIEFEINKEGYILKDSSFEESVHLTVAVFIGQQERLIKAIADISGGTATVTELDVEYVMKEID